MKYKPSTLKQKTTISQTDIETDISRVEILSDY
jgi:hypothetical protein